MTVVLLESKAENGSGWVNITGQNTAIVSGIEGDLVVLEFFDGQEVKQQEVNENEEIPIPENTQRMRATHQRIGSGRVSVDIVK